MRFLFVGLNCSKDVTRMMCGGMMCRCMCNSMPKTGYGGVFCEMSRRL